MFHAVPFDGEENTALFGVGEGFYGTSIHIATSVLDLKKDGDSVFFGDDINLSSLGCDVVSFYDLVVVFLEVLYGEEFRLVAYGSGGNGHIIQHLLYSYL